MSRVAIVSPYDPRPAHADDPLALRGGVEEALDRCAQGLAARGHEVTIVCSAPEAGDSVDDDGVRIVRVRRRGAFFRNPIAPLRRHIPADAEVVHVPATYPFVSDMIPLRESPQRAVIVDYHFDVHGTSAAMGAAAWAHRATLGRGILSATRIVCKSLDYARHSRILKRLPADRLDWVPNGVDLADFPLHGGAREGILCVGRLVPYKGVETLLRAMPSIHRESGIGLTLVGDGPERERLLALAAKLRAPVHFRGRVPADELARLYGGARLTVLPSANSQEAFGIALLESMATGTPVVASDLPGVREIALLAGTTAACRDPDALAAAILQALREPARFGAPAAIRARVARTYAWPRVVERLEDVYERALEQTAARRARPSSRRARVPIGGV